MKRTRFTEPQIVYALKLAESGTSVANVCRKYGISDATFYTWRKKYGGLGVSELRRLRELDAENKHLKQLVADLTLDKHMLQEVIQKNFKAGRPAGVGGVFNGGFSDQRTSWLSAVAVSPVNPTVPCLPSG